MANAKVCNADTRGTAAHVCDGEVDSEVSVACFSDCFAEVLGTVMVDRQEQKRLDPQPNKMKTQMEVTRVEGRVMMNCLLDVFVIQVLLDNWFRSHPSDRS